LQPRDFIYVDDVTALLRKAASEPKVRGRILLAGTGRRQTVRDMWKPSSPSAAVGPRYTAPSRCAPMSQPSGKPTLRRRLP
jgi:nucleoside-diphosphate-sugar epimerase